MALLRTELNDRPSRSSPFLKQPVSVSVGGIVMRSSTRISAVFLTMSRFATVLARVDVCGVHVDRVGHAISSLVLGFYHCLFSYLS